MMVSNSAGELGEGSEPSVLRRFTTSGSLSTTCTSALILSTIAWGVPLGAIRPNHEEYLKLGTPDSTMVGTSGTSLERVGEVIASMRTLPPSACEVASGTGAK